MTIDQFSIMILWYNAFLQTTEKVKKISVYSAINIHIFMYV